MKNKENAYFANNCGFERLSLVCLSQTGSPAISLILSSLSIDVN